MDWEGPGRGGGSKAYITQHNGKHLSLHMHTKEAHFLNGFVTNLFLPFLFDPHEASRNAMPSCGHYKPSLKRTPHRPSLEGQALGDV